jgi:hypothetical protein
MGHMDGHYLDNIRAAVREAVSCPCTHVGTFFIREEGGGQILWDGPVELFELVKHAEAKRAFAWRYVSAKSKPAYAVVLEKPPIDSPRAAVRSLIESGELGPREPRAED